MYNITLENQISLKNYLSSELTQLKSSIKFNEDIISQPLSEVEETLKNSFVGEELIQRLEELRKEYQYRTELLANQTFIEYWLEKKISEF